MATTVQCNGVFEPACCPQRRVMLFASDVAAALGWNTYSCPKDVAQRIAHTLFPSAVEPVADGVDAEVARVVTTLGASAAIDLAARHTNNDASATEPAPASAPVPAPAPAPAPAVATVAEAVTALRATVAEVAQRAMASTTASELAAAEADVPRVLLPAVQSLAFTHRGMRDELSALELFAAASGVAVSVSVPTFVSRRLPGDQPLFVGGRVDGMTADGSAVIEVKSRQRMFFSTIPRRELAQIMVYMFVHNVQRAVHVQLFDGVVKFENVAWDTALWARMCCGLLKFYACIASKYILSAEAARTALPAASDTLGLSPA